MALTASPLPGLCAPPGRTALKARPVRCNRRSDDAQLDPSQLHSRNRNWLEAMAASPDAASRLWWRNALVEQNLALVRMVAQRHSQRSGQPFDELVSAGCLGLIRAVEAFDLRQRCNLSSFAVPYIRGAMLHDIRDHGQPLHTPRRLRELQQRARRLQEQRRGAGLMPLPAAALAAELGCSSTQLEEAAAVQRALQVRSLDAPLPNSDGEDGGCLLDQLAAPQAEIRADDARGHWHQHGSYGIAACETSTDHDNQQHRRRWLSRQLAGLDALERRLLAGHWIDGLSWSALALELQISGHQARSRGEALLQRLQQRAGKVGCRPDTASPAYASAIPKAVSSIKASPIASRAAIAV